jgi:hypothetical protein
VRRRRRAASARASRRLRSRGRQGYTLEQVVSVAGTLRARWREYIHRSFTAAPRSRGPRPSAPPPRLARVRAPPLGRSACRRLAASPAPAHRPAAACHPPARPIILSRASRLITRGVAAGDACRAWPPLVSSLSARRPHRAAPAEAAVDCLVVVAELSSWDVRSAAAQSRTIFSESTAPLACLVVSIVCLLLVWRTSSDRSGRRHAARRRVSFGSWNLIHGRVVCRTVDVAGALGSSASAVCAVTLLPLYLKEAHQTSSVACTLKD